VTWSFGDASASTPGASVSHAFRAPGSYLVTATATATDVVGNATSRTATVVVSPAPRPNPPARPALAGRTVSARWAVGRSTTAQGATIAVSCSGGTREGCRFTRKTIRTKKAGSASLTKYLNFTTSGHRTVVSR
jgi:PKD repeat protein